MPHYEDMYEYDKNDSSPKIRKELVEAATGAKPGDKKFETIDHLKEQLNILLSGDTEIDAMIQDCIQTFKQKGDEYTVGSVDRLANFRGAGEDIDVPMEKVWYIFFNKHVRSIAAYIKNDCQVKSSEAIHGRIMDAIVYLLLFDKMTKEIEASRVQPEFAELKF